MPIRLTKAVKVLLIASFVVFVIQQTGDQFLGTHITTWLGLNPATLFNKGTIWQFFTYSFLHHDVMHLFFDLMMLAFIGTEIESVWGIKKFLRYYFFCATVSALAFVLLAFSFRSTELGMLGMQRPMIGATGAIYGLLMAYGLMFGERVLLFMMLFPIKAKHFVWILALLELMTTIYSSGGALASVGHLGGMIAGFGFLWGKAYFNVVKKRRELGEKSGRKRRKNQHLKLIVNNDKDFESQDEGPNDNPKTWH